MRLSVVFQQFTTDDECMLFVSRKEFFGCRWGGRQHGREVGVRQSCCSSLSRLKWHKDARHYSITSISTGVPF